MSFSPDSRGSTGLDAAEGLKHTPIAPSVASSPSHATAVDPPELRSTLGFEGQYAGQMAMAADWATVGNYLNHHQDWFPRCAHPMPITPISDHGYALVVGHFSMLGYAVEPQVGLFLAPLNHGFYRIETMAIPGYVPPGYDVDFQAVLHLKDYGTAEESALTQIDWTLSLTVRIHKPRFLNALPQALIKASGDKLLNQVMRQVSKRLTRKVQEDFHSRHGLSLPNSYHRSKKKPAA
ncbi:MAG: hypothetical protein RLZZ597_1526 [Cyanobacteriota bacterium]|jgi:hypothetical protein